MLWSHGSYVLKILGFLRQNLNVWQNYQSKTSRSHLKNAGQLLPFRQKGLPFQAAVFEGCRASGIDIHVFIGDF